MEVSEKQLEDFICLDNTDELRGRGLESFGHQKLFRQVNLGAFGIADLIGVSSGPGRNGRTDVQVVIYELKKDEIGMSELGQICRYRRVIENYFFDKRDVDLELICVLIGSSIEQSSNFVYAASAISLLSCYTYSFDITGLHFEYIETSDLVPGHIEEKGVGVIETIFQY